MTYKKIFYILIIGLVILSSIKLIILNNNRLAKEFINNSLRINLLLFATSLTYYQDFINYSDSLKANKLKIETELDTLSILLNISLSSAYQININLFSKNIHPDFRHQFQNFKNCVKLRLDALKNKRNLSNKKADSLYSQWKKWCDINIIPYSDSLKIYQNLFIQSDNTQPLP